MLYMMPQDLFGNALQSWMAAARDQATMQMIATLSAQKSVQTGISRSLESCALYLEEQGGNDYPARGAPMRPAPAHAQMPCALEVAVGRALAKLIRCRAHQALEHGDKG